MLIHAERLEYIYAPNTPLAHKALRGVDLEIRPGERVGILGRTGSGKSTLVQLLAGLMAPTAGRVWLDGAMAHERDPAARRARRQVGLSFQYPEDQFFEQTVWREIAFGPRNAGLRPAEVNERILWALETVGLDPASVKDRVPFSLSGGEMRRVALASVLALRPQVLILDEPTSSMDPGGQRELLARIKAWQEESGLTLIIVSHSAGVLAQTVDRAVVLREGRVAADGPARAILSDTALLGSVDLDTPKPATLLRALRQAGWDVRTDLLLPEEAVHEILRARHQLEAKR